MNFGKQLKEGLISQNPVLVQLLGMCSTLAITTSFFNGLGMGVSVLVILTLSNIIISLLRKIIPNEVRIACYIVVIAGFVTCVDLILKAFVPALSNSLGVFIPLIVVNCIILGRAEAFASKNGVGAAAVDGICQGIGYTLVLIIMCVFRELLGAGTFGAGLLGGGELGAAPGLRVIPEQFGIKILTMPVGGFLTLGALIAAMQWALTKSKNKKKEAK
ncbi:MAG: electron transport complex subunit RsxE [Oscillospiraceae bacterium]|nr:electron transport complex subunit RsxE [Oscillospiraceae bacterium]